MSETELRERAMRVAPEVPVDVEKVMRLGRSRRRTRTLGSVAAALVVATGVVIGAQAFRSGPDPEPALPDEILRGMPVWRTNIIAPPDGWEPVGEWQPQPTDVPNGRWRDELTSPSGCVAATFTRAAEELEVNSDTGFVRDDRAASIALVEELAARDGAVTEPVVESIPWGSVDPLSGEQPEVRGVVGDWVGDAGSTRVAARSDRTSTYEGVPYSVDTALRLVCPGGAVDDGEWSALLESSRWFSGMTDDGW